jgi:hypothetical protein
VAERRAAVAEARAAAAEAKVRGGAQTGKTTNGDAKFMETKRAFARLYHPDNLKTDGLDKIIRAETFKEYWGQLEKIQGRKR